MSSMSSMNRAVSAGGRSCKRYKRISAELIDDFIAHETGEGGEKLRSLVVRELLSCGLTATQKEYVLLRYVHNLNGAEIARLYGVNRSTVSKTLARARMRIIRALDTVKLRKRLELYLSEAEGEEPETE